jgi:hypothetical protein
LNPRAAINDLHPFQGCPFSLLGTSPNTDSDLSSPTGSYSISVCKKQISGEDGIRTHVGLPPNGFQDRLVMTASIPLHIVPSVRHV